MLVVLLVWELFGRFGSYLLMVDMCIVIECVDGSLLVGVNLLMYFVVLWGLEWLVGKGVIF